MPFKMLYKYYLFTLIRLRAKQQLCIFPDENQIAILSVYDRLIKS